MAINPSHTDNKPRVFSPVVIVHNSQCFDHNEQHRSYIGVHKERIEEMLIHNAKEWTGFHYVAEPIHYEADRESTSSESSRSSTSLSPSPIHFELQSSLEESLHTLAKPNQKKRRGNLPKHVTAILKSWLAQHVKHPYPTEDEKIALAMETKLTMNQISNWFINARRRILQPMIENAQASGELRRQSCDLEMIQFSGAETPVEDNTCGKRRYSSAPSSKKSTTSKKHRGF
ncbi:Homeobox protein tos8 [Basidiobolus ranarum]|uniref:Homeobox protein tos8 n=1 Tax=Basidiobolus ranarum TaxID=34480 RepID=A0ABR2WGE8_9FUNG